LQDAELIRAVRAAGFEDVEIVLKHETEAGASAARASQFGTQGISFRARKPG
jgi:hypothetical protein